MDQQNELRVWKSRARDGQLPPDPSTLPPEGQDDEGVRAEGEGEDAERAQGGAEDEAADDGDLDAAINASATQGQSAPAPAADNDPGFNDADLFGLDLDQFDADEAAMAEMESGAGAPPAKRPRVAEAAPGDFGFDDEEEEEAVLREMEEAERRATAASQRSTQPKPPQD